MFDREAIAARITEWQGYATEDDINAYIEGMDKPLYTDSDMFSDFLNEEIADANFAEEI